MRYRVLGGTELKVSELCLGTMTFGSNFFNIAVVDQSTATKMVCRSLDSGINFFDTADVYSFGQSEKILGRALKECGVSRDKVIIASKVGGPMSPNTAAGIREKRVGLSRQHIMSSIEQTLRRLDLDYIDLYQVHCWDILTRVDEVMRALDYVVRQGKVRYLGCSNWAARHLMKALCLSEANHWHRFVSLQSYYSLVARDVEHELLPLCREEDLAVLCWSPLAGGFLTGKYAHNRPVPENGRRKDSDFPPIADMDRALAAVEILGRIAREREASIAQVALAWLLSQRGVTSVIIGANKMSQLSDNLLSTDLMLEAAEIEMLSATTAPQKLYPEWMIEQQNMGRMLPPEKT
jgi:aryl-alcohol dehydrogenase-like predicted oxidoreductase